MVVGNSRQELEAPRPQSRAEGEYTHGSLSAGYLCSLLLS